MKRLKQFIALLLCLCVLFPLIVSCGGGESPADENPSDQNGKDPSDKESTDQKGEDDKVDSYPLLNVKNQMAFSPVAMRSYYPDHNALLTRLMQIRNAVKDNTLNDARAIRSEMVQVMQMAEKLGIYYDYYNHTAYVDGDKVYGARVGEHPIGGGGSGYSVSKNVIGLPIDDNTLHSSSLYVYEGEALLIADDVVIDLSDYILAGDSNGFTGSRIEYDWTVGEGVTWFGKRGVDGGLGGILKVTSHTDCTIVLEKNARLSGLVIQGPDSPIDVENAATNLSIGIVVKGDGAIIENCEISGFGQIGVQVIGANDVVIRNCYFHDIAGKTSGYAVSVTDSSVEMYGNLFSAVTTPVAIKGTGSKVNFHDNMDAGNITGPYFELFNSGGNDVDFSVFGAGSDSVIVQNNTFLSLTDLVKLSGLPRVFSVENNLFAYPEYAYSEKSFMLDNVDGSLFDLRIVFKNNVFDITAPLVLSKSSSAKKIPDNKLLGSYSALVSDQLVPFEIAETKAEAVTYSAAAKLPVLAALYYSEDNDKGYAQLRALLTKDDLTLNTVFNDLTTAIASIGGYSNYLTFDDAGLITFIVDGQRYGAYSDGDRIGGGYDYSEIFTTGDYVVTNEDELVAALQKAKSGQVVFIPGGTYINISDCATSAVRTLVIPAGVTLASDRGRVMEDGTVSIGAIIASSVNNSSDLTIDIGGEGVRLTGLVIKGPDPASHVSHGNRTASMEHGNAYYNQITRIFGINCSYNNCEFDNIEIAGYNTVGLGLGNLENAVTGAEVHHNFVHHNQIYGLGYGIRIDDAYVNITYNMFNYNRHSIASGGMPHCAYTAENNIEMGNSLDHYYDMHGGADRKDGTEIAGDYVYMRYNSFLGDKRPFHQRGFTVTGQDFSYNVTYGSLDFAAGYLGTYNGKPLKNSTIGKNVWNIQSGKIKVTQGGV